MQEGGGKEFVPLGLVAWWCWISEAAAVKVLHRWTRARKSTQSQRKKKGVHTAAWHSPSSLHTVVTAPAACDHGHWRQLQPQQWWRGSCSPASSRPALSLRKGNRSWRRGREAPCRAASSTDPRSLLEWALDCSDVAIPSGAPGVWR